MVGRRSLRTQFLLALAFAALVNVGLFAYGAYRNQSLGYSYLLWNLFLAGLPLAFSLRVVQVLQKKRWSAWEPLFFSLLWFVFLPNSFYMVSDFIHLQDAASVDVLYDAVMFTGFIFTALLLGFSSLYLMHLELKRRVRSNAAASLIGIVLLICSFGIYIGRDLRWNSWDVITNPGGLLFDISDRVLHPDGYPEMFRTTIIFFVLLSSMYLLVWRIARLLRQSGAQELAAYSRHHHR